MPVNISDPAVPPSKPFYHYIPLAVTVFLIVSPHPSLLIFLVKYHLLALHSPLKFYTHLLVTYTLTFLIFSSLIVCAARDPGPVGFEEAVERDADADDGEMSFAEALLAPADDEDFNSPQKWCKKCWAPKPERTHHCSECGRCVLKMDHHCPWIGAKCVGHRTYPAFVHFLACITLLAFYLACIACPAVWWTFTNPWAMDEMVMVHELILAAMGIIFTMVIGSFLGYHLYLISTNQTTIEHISPFILLRHLPRFPEHSGRQLSSPPSEDELSYEQRYLVRSANGQIRVYGVGLKRNWAQVFGWDAQRRPWGLLGRLLYGGGSAGDGRSFPRNPRADEMLSRLARDLVSANKNA